jgi:uncharacterized membrane protein (UPF0127 family)
MALIPITINKKRLRVKDCKGLSSVRGLMFDSLKGKDGALVYGNRIWMPFVKKPLTLIFLDKNYAVTSVQEAVPITLNPKTWKIYSDKSAKYCLELVKKIKIKKNTLVRKGP